MDNQGLASTRSRPLCQNCHPVLGISSTYNTCGESNSTRNCSERHLCMEVTADVQIPALTPGLVTLPRAKAGTFAVHPPMICQHAVAPEGQQTRAHKNARIGMKSRLCSRPLSNRMRCHRQQSNSPGAALEGPLLLGCQLGTPVSPSLPYRWHAGVWSKGLNTRAN